MQVKWSEKQLATLRNPYSHCLEVNEGSPRSGKSSVDVARFALFVWQSPDQNHLVLAYSQEQAFKLVMDCDGFGLQSIFPGLWQMKHDDFGDHMELQTPNGTKRIYYKGGGKADSHKSFVGLSIGSVYFCEINLLHLNAIQEAFRRTFAAKRRWHIADLNPPAPQDPIISEVFDVQDTFWQHWTIDDNPIITPERKEEIRRTCEKNPYLWERDWLGNRAIPEGVIYSMFSAKDCVLTELRGTDTPVEMFFAGDGGLTDATSIGCYIVARSTKDGKFVLYRVANWHYDGARKAMSTQAREIADEFVPYCRNLYKMRETCWKIDPACKALRMELEKVGIPTDGADNNGKDIRGTSRGIRVGIEFAQSAIQDGRFFLVDDKRFGAAPFLREVGLYCTDSHGTPIDAHNHCMDEFRYAMNYFYKNYVL